MVFLLLAPTVAASDEIVVEGSAYLPDDARVLVADPRAFLLNDTRGLASLDLTAPVARVYVTTMEYVSVENVRVKMREESSMFTATDLVVSLVDEHNGARPILGLYPHGGTVSATSASGVKISPIGPTRYGAAYFSGADQETTSRSYDQLVPSPHLRIETDGRVAYEGAGIVKLFGPGVTVRTSTNTTMVQSGNERYLDPGGGRERDTIVAFEFDAGLFVIDTGVPLILAAPDTEAGWKGRAVFTQQEAPAGLVPSRDVAVLGERAALIETTGTQEDPRASVYFLEPVVTLGMATPEDEVDGPVVFALAAGGLLALAGVAWLVAWQRRVVGARALDEVMRRRFPPGRAQLEAARLLAADEQWDDAATRLIRAIKHDHELAVEASLDEVFHTIVERPEVRLHVETALRARGLL